MVFYRKYRPQKISDLDSTAVREKLLSVFSTEGSIPHAFLFTGPKGLGKTSIARIIAKAINCGNLAINKELRTKNLEQKGKFLSSQSSVLSGEAVEPCNVCDSCVSITNGTNLDVLEIDAASNRGIDEIRELKDKIRLSPVAAKKKVYIIDEVHMLTTEAFNALLKTLEEPPDHAMFVLCTTEPHKVIGTIISRCFHIHFNLATEEEIVHSLRRIVLGEKLQIDDTALVAIAKIADGGFRDAAKILEELSLLSQDEKITKELFEELYKTVSISVSVTELLTALHAQKVKDGLEVIKVVISQGIDIRYFISQVLADLHKQLLIKIGVEVGTNPIFEVAEIKNLVSLFSAAYQETKYAVVPQLPIELAVIEYTTVVIPSSSISSDVKSSQPPFSKGGDEALPPLPKGGVPQDGGFIPDEVTVSSLRKQVGVIQKNKALYGEPKVTNDEPTIETLGVDLMKVPVDGEVTKEWQDVFWKSVISEMKQYNHTVAGVLRSCSVKNYDKKQLIIETAYKFHKERLDEVKTQEALAAVCKILTGNDLKIAVELKNS